MNDTSHINIVAPVMSEEEDDRDACAGCGDAECELMPMCCCGTLACYDCGTPLCMVCNLDKPSICRFCAINTGCFCLDCEMFWCEDHGPDIPCHCAAAAAAAASSAGASAAGAGGSQGLLGGAVEGGFGLAGGVPGADAKEDSHTDNNKHEADENKEGGGLA